MDQYPRTSLIHSRILENGTTRREILKQLALGISSAACCCVLPDLGTWGASRTRHDSAAVTVKQEGEGAELTNGLVRAHFLPGPNGIVQEYAACDARGRWTVIVSALNIPPFPPPSAAPLYQRVETSRLYRILVNDSFSKIGVINQEAGPTVVLSGMFEGATLKQHISLLPGESHFHIKVHAELPGTPPRLEYLLSAFAFQNAEVPDFTFAPALKRSADDVVADRVFLAPAVLVQKRNCMAAIVPDLRMLNQDLVLANGVRRPDGPRFFGAPTKAGLASMPSLIDLELRSGVTTKPVFSFGLGDWVSEPHVYWRHENQNGAMIRELSSNHVAYGFDLFVTAEAVPYRGYQQVSQYLWNEYAPEYLRNPRPQAMPLVEYARVCYPAALAYPGDSAENTQDYVEGKPFDPKRSSALPTWLEFDLNEKSVGGIRGTPTQWYNDIQFLPWWNNARDAIGMYWWGNHGGDPALVDKAFRIIALALSAPQHHGMFPAVFHYDKRSWSASYWKFGADYKADWLFPETFQPSHNPKYWDFNSDLYQCSAASTTGANLLRFRRLCQDYPGIVQYLKSYGDFIVKHTSKNGLLPGFFTADLQPSAALNFNAEGGIHIWFLCELFETTHDRRYLETAKRMAAFLHEEILPHQRWADFETFFSCSVKPETFFDDHTGQWPQCTMSMVWAIQGLSMLYSLTLDRTYLKDAEAVADFSGFYQACWQPNYVTTAYVFGGFRSQNSDAEWLDMRQSLFADAYATLARLSHRQDLYERAVAALHASFAVTNHPRHIQNDIFRLPLYPLGTGPENIDHDGLPETMLRSGFSWAEGGGLTSAALLLKDLGGAFIDLAHNVQIGVDGVRVEALRVGTHRVDIQVKNQLGTLPMPYSAPYAIDLQIIGMLTGRYEVAVNGAPPRVFHSSDGRMTVEVEPPANVTR